MNACAQCGVSTSDGQFYRFYFGKHEDVIDEAPRQGETSVGPYFRPRGSEDMFFCDRCIMRRVVGGARFRAVLHLSLATLGFAAAGFLFFAGERAWWLGVLLGIVAAVLGSAALGRWRQWLNALDGKDAAARRAKIAQDAHVQSLGDEWAISRRWQALVKQGMGMFLTRGEFVFLAPPNDGAPTVRDLNHSKPDA